MEFNTPNKSNKGNIFIPATPNLEKIGFGTGISVYHLDKSPRFGISPWAIKKVNTQHLPKKEYTERLKREANILSNLNHPNIIGFRGFCQTPTGREVLVMEECAKCLGNLKEERLEKELGPFHPSEIKSVISGVSNALHYLHTIKKILHGDLKSYNVLIKGNFQVVKLCDFGVSIELNDENQAMLEAYVGTDAWTAPEVLEYGPLTPKADIFSFGLIIYELLSLKTPNVGDVSSSSSMDEESYCIETFGERPPLNETEFTSDYRFAIDIFNQCTEADYNLRPDAIDIINQIAKE